ncbi:MAG: hypothetical protein EOM63_04960 [Clostridia bacterium]|nr:hypothetical protein [Clostridia bacterium]
MMSRSSFCDFCGLVRETLRRNIWALALSMLTFLCTLPLPIAMVVQNARQAYFETEELRTQSVLRSLSNMLGMDNYAIKCALAVLAVVCGVVLFRYLHARQQTDFYHSLPISRGRLFAVNFVSGFVIVVPAYLLCWVLAALTATASGYSTAIGMGMPVAGLLGHLIFFAATYAVSVLCTIVCGNTIVSLLLLAWTLFSPSLLLVGIEGLKSAFYSTHVGMDRLSSLLSIRLSPVLQSFFFTTGARMNNYTGDAAALPHTARLLLGYALAFVLLTLLARLLFLRRPSERAGSAIAFRRLETPLKFWCVTVMAVMIGLLFHSLVNRFWMYFGFALGAVLTHMLMEIIYAFDFRACVKRARAFAIFAVLFAAVIAAAANDVIGFDRYVPSVDTVEAVAVTDYDLLDMPRNTNKGDSVFADLTDPTNIQTTIDLATYGVEHVYEPSPDNATPEDHTLYSINIRYLLHSGREVQRQYNILMPKGNEDTVRKKLESIAFSQEYIIKRSPIYTFALTGKDRLVVLDGEHDQRLNPAGVTEDVAQIGEIIKTLREETLTLTPEQAHTVAPLLRIELLRYATSPSRDNIRDDEEHVYSAISDDGIYVYPTYTRTLALLKKYTNVIPTPLSAANVRSIDLSIYGIPDATTGQPDAKRGDSRTVTDPVDIALLLQDGIASNLTPRPLTLANSILQDYGFQVNVVYRNGDNRMIYYLPEHVPTSIFTKYFY